MNVLLTSAGRRTSLLAAFRKAAERRGGKVFAADVDALAPALSLAEHAIRLPKVDDPNYLSSLIEWVERHRIRLIVPTIDLELPLLSDAAPMFADRGCRVLVSEKGLVQIAGDKWETARAFGARGVRVPDSWLPEHLKDADLPERLFIKPRGGSASQGTYRVHRDELMGVLPLVSQPIIQEEISAPEISIDALLDFQGRVVHYVPRLRIRAVGGESIQGVTLPDEGLRDWLSQALEFVAGMGGIGPVTLQAFMTSKEPTFSEINPRFGGGFPLALAAGGDYPEWIMSMLEGSRVAPRLGEYRRHLYMTRYYVELITEQPLWH
jgi:carbamoyl-phosphate synthase large subunit